jgi:CBS domain-containing protein
VSISTTELLVSGVMLALDRVPVVKPDTLLKVALADMTRHRLGIACIVDSTGLLAGVFTDGDVRRMLLKDQKPFAALFVDDIIIHANRNPITVKASDTLGHAVGVMEKKGIWDLPVIDADNKLVGLLHLHPAIKAVMGLST